ncbi:hypothetical protein [Zoogloea sp.]|uniref:hypothetical protein n=1 Tax=Zoogloea sp. TaxID=49181 RepID=UPI00261E5816|nr:hypothetical protein [uncultured Zoogloea sp.]
MPMSEKNLRDMMMPPEDRRTPANLHDADPGLARAQRGDKDWGPTRYEAWSILAPLLTAGLTLLLAKATGISGGFGGIIFSPWVGAGLILLAVTVLNFIIMTITWAPRVYGVKGFLGVVLLWIFLLASLGH